VQVYQRRALCGQRCEQGPVAGEGHAGKVDLEELGTAMRRDRIGMSNNYRFTAISYDSFQASEWASPRFVMVSMVRSPLVYWCSIGEPYPRPL
jgi:hypothetical protein